MRLAHVGLQSRVCGSHALARTPVHSHASAQAGKQADKTGVLFVCWGNICRSPTAEAVMKDVIQKAGKKAAEFDIDSCGTGGGNPDWYKEGQWSYHEGARLQCWVLCITRGLTWLACRRSRRCAHDGSSREARRGADVQIAPTRA